MMIGIQTWLSPEAHEALKLYALKHGYKSKAKAAEALVEEGLVRVGYLEIPEIDPRLGEYGYEYLEDV